jgi:2-polyprenyl-3-methyl-5-hydroxy-6-metoxy-1,4-benzoquinol methylase
MARALVRMLGISSTIRDRAIRRRLRIVVYALRTPAVGYLAFMLNLILKKIALLFGEDDQRPAEYAWILQQLSLLSRGSNVLDVGCSESVLSHVLVMRGFKVTGLDLRDYPFRTRQMSFVKRNIADTGFADDYFDGIVVVSTIEHVGLDVYGQHVLDSALDVKAMSELTRILKPGGIVLVTTPFVGKAETRITRTERQYGFSRLEKLIGDLSVVREDYFSLYRYRHGLRWVRHDREGAEKARLDEAGIACLVLRKCSNCAHSSATYTSAA